MGNREWCAISFSLPRSPSKARVGAWRKIKQIGAIGIGQSVWILPNEQKYLSAFEEIGKYVDENNGRHFIFKSVFQKSDEEIIALFNKERDEEYNELLDKCEDFFEEIDKETKKRNFCYGELEENEQELEKLIAWFEKILMRDFFTSIIREKVESDLHKCKLVFEQFSDRVYQENALAERENND